MTKTKPIKKGSAILTVLLIMSAVIFCGFNLYKSTILTVDLVLLRQEREQKKRAAEGVLNYGISLCSKRFDSLCLQSKKGINNWSFQVGHWKINEEKIYKGYLKIYLKNKIAHIFASLLENNNSIFGLECKIERRTKKNKAGQVEFFVVHDWKIQKV